MFTIYHSGGIFAYASITTVNTTILQRTQCSESQLAKTISTQLIVLTLERNIFCHVYIRTVMHAWLSPEK